MMSKHPRRGAILVITAFLLIFLMALSACVLDLGWIVLTRTELQAAADSSALAGGTELLPGLGRLATMTPGQVVTAGGPRAVEYAGFNRNGDVQTTFADATRDVRFGWGTFDTASGTWVKQWGVTGPSTGYNMVGVTLHRNVASSSNDDDRLPLFVGPALGMEDSGLTATATAVILPAKGFRITPGSEDKAALMPFALHKTQWDNYLRAQDYYALYGFPAYLDPRDIPEAPDPGSNEPAVYYRAPDPLDPSDLGVPLFGHYTTAPGGDIVFRQDFDDLHTVADQAAELQTVTPGPDGILELDAYPRDDATNGNFGTIDIGNHNNSTAELSRQIVHGVDDDDLAYFPNSALTVPNCVPGGFDVDGETGVSVGIKAALDQIVGQCRVAALFESVSGNGDTANYCLCGWAGVRLMDVRLTGSLDFKNLKFQLCRYVGNGTVGDPTDTIGPDTTVFSPLILIE